MASFSSSSSSTNVPTTTTTTSNTNQNNGNAHLKEEAGGEERDSLASTHMAPSQAIKLRVQKKIASRISRKSMVKLFLDESSARLVDNLSLLIKSYCLSEVATTTANATSNASASASSSTPANNTSGGPSGSTIGHISESEAKKRASKLIKHMIKLNVKLGIMFLNEQNLQAAASANQSQLTASPSMLSAIMSEEETEMCVNFKEILYKLASSVLKLKAPFCNQKRETVMFLQAQIEKARQLLLRLTQGRMTEKNRNKINECADFLLEPRFIAAIFSQASPYKEAMDQICVDLEEMIVNGLI